MAVPAVEVHPVAGAAATVVVAAAAAVAAGWVSMTVPAGTLVPDLLITKIMKAGLLAQLLAVVEG